MITRKCSICKRDLPATKEYFYAQATVKDGFSSACKECRGRQFRIPYTAGINDVTKEKRCTACGRIFPRTDEYFHKVSVKDVGYFRARCKECMADDYAARKGKAGALTDIQFRRIKSYFNDSCAFCGSKTRVKRDFIIPISQGGEKVKENCIAVCSYCISHKKERNALEWFREQECFTEERLQKILAAREEFKDRESKKENDTGGYAGVVL